MRVTSVFVVALAIISVRDALAVEAPELRCAVCGAAVSDLYRRLEVIREECRHPDNETGITEDCHVSRVLPAAVQHRVGQVCDDLPTSHSFANENGRHRVHPLGDDEVTEPHPTPELIQEMCRQWIHTDKNIDAMGLYFVTNINSRKEHWRIVPRLQHRFCQSACDLGPIPPRKRELPQRQQERVHDWTYAQHMEEATRRASQEQPDPSQAPSAADGDL